MSELSAQCDELRAMAESVGLAIPRAATLMMEAADTIEGLESENDRLQAARDVAVEDAKEIAAQLCDARAENVKLRELLVDTLMHPREYCEKYGIEYEGWESVDEHIYARMRDLGVEP